MTTALQINRLVIGSTIAAFELQPIENGYFDPLIILENGTRVSFMVQEMPDGSGYGILPVIVEK